MTAELIHNLHFVFTITFHELFSQLTMGLGLLIVASVVTFKPATCGHSKTGHFA